MQNFQSAKYFAKYILPKMLNFSKFKIVSNFSNIFRIMTSFLGFRFWIPIFVRIPTPSEKSDMDKQNEEENNEDDYEWEWELSDLKNVLRVVHAEAPREWYEVR